MSTGEARHGRRDNGLHAAAYAPAGDVDPRVGEHLLDVLALDGIAAYLRPSTDMNPVTRQTSLPARPTDRLYVDRAHLAAARGYLAKLTEEAAAETGPSAAITNVDDEWARIVAAYDDDVAQVRRPWPAVEDVPRAGGADAGPPRTPSVAPAPEEPQPSLLDALDTFGAHLPDEDEGYTPPAPPPVPRPSLPAVLGVAGIVGGLLLFLRPDLLPIAEGTVMLLGFLAIVAGFGTLVWRLRPGDDDEDPDPDDGARV